MTNDDLIALLREARQVINGEVEYPLGITDRIDEALTELSHTCPPVMEGWQLVPVEPTREMIASCDARFIPRIALPVFVAAYKTMLEAAPKP